MKTKQFYLVSNPTIKNECTGNVCIAIKDLLKFDKDFLFEQEIDGIKYEKVLKKEWVRDNAKFIKSKKEDPKTLKETYRMFYLLKIEDILKY